MDKMLLITTTFETKAQAVALANTLLEKRLICCAQVSAAVESLYHWKGSVAQEKEYILIVKSMERLWNELEQEIVSMHPYDVPEIIATPVTHSNMGYQQWVISELKK